ncbi:MAG: 1,4-dihydroxy-2-naphthoate polyprenyltransferase [Acidobacteriota bacterium]
MEGTGNRGQGTGPLSPELVPQTPDPGARGGRWQAWVLAARPKTLPAAASPVVLGSACAFAVGGFRLGPALAALSGALLIQIATNFANDVADFERGTDTEARLGPTRVTQAGLLSPREVKAGVAVAFLLAVAVGAYLTAVAGWPVVIIGIASIGAGLAYSNGPFPLSHHGVGEPFVMVFFGFAAVAGTAFVQVTSVPAAAWWGGLIAGAFTTAILVVNNTRDHATDRAAGRRTVPARFGRRAGIVELVAFLALGYGGTVGMDLAGGAGRWTLIAFATLPLAVVLVRRLAARDDGPTGNRVLAGTGGLLLLHCLLLSFGLVAGRVGAP